MNLPQMIRALGQPCRLAGLHALHAAAVALEEEATHDDVLGLLDALSDAVDQARPVAERPERQAHPEAHPEAHRVLPLVAEGLHDPAIADRLGLTVHQVRRARRAAGVAANPGAPARSGWEERIRAAHGRGLSTRGIAEATGYSYRTCQEYLGRLGLRAHKGRLPPEPE